MRKKSITEVILQKLELEVLGLGSHEQYSPEAGRRLSVIMTLLDILRDSEIRGWQQDYLIKNLPTLASNAEIVVKDAGWEPAEGDAHPAALINELLTKLKEEG